MKYTKLIVIFALSLKLIAETENIETFLKKTEAFENYKKRLNDLIELSDQEITEKHAHDLLILFDEAMSATTSKHKREIDMVMFFVPKMREDNRLKNCFYENSEDRFKNGFHFSSKECDEIMQSYKAAFQNYKETKQKNQ